MKKPVRYDQLSQLAGFSNTILTMALVAISAVGIYYGVSAYVYQGTQDRFALQLEQNVVSNISYVESQILSNVSQINADIAAIEDAFNMTTGTGATLSNRISTLESSTVRMINDVLPEAMTGKITLDPGLGIDIVNNVTENHIEILSTGVVTINGVEAGNTAPGELTISTTAMLSLVNDVNASEITIDASAFVTSINNLQNEDVTLAMDIVNLQNTANNLQMQIDALEAVGMMLNDTGMDLNMTVMELLVKAMMNEQRIDQLEEQLANLTGLAAPVGSMVPWTGSDAAIPDGYLLCDGTAYNQTDYMMLWAAIGTVYCPGMVEPSPGEFCVPDMRGRVPVGRATTGSAFDMGVLGGARGTAPGEDVSTLTVTELPSHTHSGTTDTGGNHTHTSNGLIYVYRNALVAPYDTSFSDFGDAAAPDMGSIRVRLDFTTTIGSAGSHTHAFTTNSQGSGAGFTNVQPSMIMHYIIKT